MPKSFYDNKNPFFDALENVIISIINQFHIAFLLYKLNLL